MTTAYVDRTYYTNTYLGSLIPAADFSAYALRASAKIDQLTFQRALAYITANDPAATVTAIKMATCAVADEMYEIAQEGNIGGIQSESVGGHSVSYLKGSIPTLSSDARLRIEAGTYLSSTGLLFRGFADGEYGTTISDDEDE